MSFKRETSLRKDRPVFRDRDEQEELETAAKEKKARDKAERGRLHPLLCTQYVKGMEGTFTCTGKCGLLRPVWGGQGGLYTSDSCICQAARHRGVIPRTGGTFEVALVEGLDKYVGFTQNNVISLSYGPFESSITLTEPLSIAKYCCGLCLYII